MKFRLAAASIAAACMLGGCKTNAKKPPMAVNPAVTEVGSVVAPTAPSPVIAAPAQPVVYEVAPSSAATPAAAAPTASAGGGSYTVQKGDTISNIARARYGNVNAVRKIKEANPGVDYNNIKPGQKLILP